MATIRMTMAQALLRFLDNQYISVDGKETKFVKRCHGDFRSWQCDRIGRSSGEP